MRISGTLTTDYAYYEWDETAMLDGYAVGQGGRLESLTTGSLQGLSYLYDAAGNVRKISNTAPNPDDVLDFTYDALDRLLSVRTALSEDYAYDQQGRLSSKTGVGTYGYNDSNHEHAVTHLGGVQKYWYDANGNMTTRVIGGSTFNLSYDTENHLTGVSGAATASFVYDGDGNRVKGTVGGTTTVYIGNHFEWTSAGNTKYYYHGATRVAMRRSSYAMGNGVFFLLGDHLGSTSLSTDSAGGNPTELRYKPWGETRFSSGTTQTTFRFTGQRQEAALGGADGLYYYGARWYDSALGRFTSPGGGGRKVRTFER